ncbi:Fur family transcriptional regulator [Brachymonas denitrificans]|uniref:Fur family transcriptional regulator n=1 Tax=Brachymonas denitrificans TaxID=28220 RepID=UPI002AFE3122|nr:transcriptional repressor [Brachymonas denitrificans]
MNQNAAPSPSEAPGKRWAEVVRAQGLRATRDVLRVLSVLESAQAPLSHEDLMRGLLADATGCAIDRVTLYRVLDRLQHVGLVTRTQDSERTFHYALAQTGSTGFFECEQCHALTALPEDPQLPALLEQLNARLHQQGLNSTDITLSVHGVCAECEESPPAGKPSGTETAKR